MHGVVPGSNQPGSNQACSSAGAAIRQPSVMFQELLSRRQVIPYNRPPWQPVQTVQAPRGPATAFAPGSTFSMVLGCIELSLICSTFSKPRFVSKNPACSCPCCSRCIIIMVAWEHGLFCYIYTLSCMWFVLALACMGWSYSLCRHSHTVLNQLICSACVAVVGRLADACMLLVLCLAREVGAAARSTHVFFCKSILTLL